MKFEKEERILQSIPLPIYQFYNAKIPPGCTTLNPFAFGETPDIAVEIILPIQN